MDQDRKTVFIPFRRLKRIWRTFSLPVLVFIFCLATVRAQTLGGGNLRQFYQKHCVECHGPDGSAVSAEGKKLSGQDFTDPGWRRSTKDEEMVETILNGIFFGWVMPDYKDSLTKNEAQQIVTDIIRKSEKGKAIFSHP